MKRLISLLLILCLLPLSALANRPMSEGLTEEEAAVLSNRYDELLKQLIPDVPYPDCCKNMSDKDAYLFVLLTYERYLREFGGLCDFMLNEPEMNDHLPFALLRVNNFDHYSEIFSFIIQNNLLLPEGFQFIGGINRNLAHSLYGFSDFDQLVEDGLWADLVTGLMDFITLDEPLWREDFSPISTLLENITFDIYFIRMTDAPWPECAATLNEDERALYLSYDFLISWEDMGLIGWLKNTDPVIILDTLSALAYAVPQSPHVAVLNALQAESGIDLTDAAALEHSDLSSYEEAFLNAEYSQGLRDLLTDFIRSHPDSFR